ncbi:MAG TPA: hypothetical protein VLX56_02565 [Nitrososphaerales archaeon]|nr:hypothetical protein [Nitrososphaerales archaeon]
MSLSHEGGRPRSGSKGFSGRKQKKKKQEYHTHKRAQFQEQAPVDPEQLRARTVLALDRLGHQVISTEPGGYDLDAWVRNLNTLLDDFQERLGGRVGQEFSELRRSTLLPLKVPAAEGPDPELEAALKEEADAREAIVDLGKKATAKLSSLTEERDSCERELKEAREKLSKLDVAKRSRGLLAKITGSGPSTEEAEERVAELEGKLRGLDEEIEAQRKARSTREGDQAAREAQARLEAADKKVAEIQAARQERLQLAGEREAAAKLLAEAISRIDLGPKEASS